MGGICGQAVVSARKGTLPRCIGIRHCSHPPTRKGCKGGQGHIPCNPCQRVASPLSGHTRGWKGFAGKRWSVIHYSIVKVRLVVGLFPGCPGVPQRFNRLRHAPDTRRAELLRVEVTCDEAEGGGVITREGTIEEAILDGVAEGEGGLFVSPGEGGVGGEPVLDDAVGDAGGAETGPENARVADGLEDKTLLDGVFDAESVGRLFGSVAAVRLLFPHTCVNLPGWCCRVLATGLAVPTRPPACVVRGYRGTSPVPLPESGFAPLWTYPRRGMLPCSRGRDLLRGERVGEEERRRFCCARRRF